jgi:hypothetical protein
MTFTDSGRLAFSFEFLLFEVWVAQGARSKQETFQG